MKILFVIGNNKKNGETIKQANYFEKYLQEYQNVVIEYLFLHDYSISECTGCNVCFQKGEEFCPMKDDTWKIVHKLQEADSIVLFSSIYSMHITTQLKILIDRLSFLIHRPIFFDKKAMIYIPKGNMFPNAGKYLYKVLNSWGFEVIGNCGLGVIDNFVEENRKNVENKLRKAVNDYMKLMLKKRKSISITNLITFKMWQLRASKYISKEDQDYKYFKLNDLFCKKYYHGIHIGIVKNVVSSIFFKIALVYMKKEMGELDKSL